MPAADADRKVTNQVPYPKSASASLSAYFSRFSDSNRERGLLIWIQEMYANQVVAQTNPRRRAPLIRTPPPPPCLHQQTSKAPV